MDLFPVELWTSITRFACFNDLKTGCSLVLTCKYLNEVTKCIRFDTISIWGSHEIIGFAALLETLPPRHRRVRNLFVSRMSWEWELYQYGQKMSHHQYNALLRGLALNRVEFTEDYRAQMRSKHFYSDHVVLPIVSQILTTISATLENLTLCDMAINLPQHNDFPVLRDLCIISGSPRAMPLIPSLRRLHFTNLYTNYDYHDLLSQGPNLQEVRVTETFGHPYSHEFILSMLSTSDMALSRLRNIFIQLDISPSHQDSESGSTTYPNVVILPPRTLERWAKQEIDMVQYRPLTALHDWLDVAQGGLGCWDNPPDTNAANDEAKIIPKMHRRNVSSNSPPKFSCCIQ